MVSKAKSVRGSSQAIDYILNDKGQAIELDRNGLVGSDGKEILNELRMVQEANTNCHNNTISIVLSPDSAQGDYSLEEMKTFLYEHLDNLGLKDNQWIATVHNSTDDKHIHVIANRINSQGKALNDSLISQRAQDSAEQIAKKHGYTTAQEVSFNKEVRTEDLKKEISKTMIQCKAKSNTFDEFCTNMRKSGFEVKPTYNSKGAMFGMRIEGGGESFKLSEVNRNIKHYHFADILPKDTLIQTPKIKAKSIPKSGNLVKDSFEKQLKQGLSKEVRNVLKADSIASVLSPEKLAVNAAKVIVKGISRGMSM
jgi:hypothetical protein